MALNLGFQEKYVLNLWSMFFALRRQLQFHSKSSKHTVIAIHYHWLCLPVAQPAHLISISFSSAHFKGEIFDYRQIEGNLCFCSMIGGIGGILHTWIADSSMQLLSDHNDLTNTVKFYSEPEVFEACTKDLNFPLFPCIACPLLSNFMHPT